MSLKMLAAKHAKLDKKMQILIRTAHTSVSQFNDKRYSPKLQHVAPLKLAGYRTLAVGKRDSLAGCLLAVPALASLIAFPTMT